MPPKGQRWYRNWKNEGFPLWLRGQMEARGWDTVVLAEKLDTKYTSGPTRWLTGETLPSPKTLRKLAEVFNLPLDEVYTAAGHLNGNGTSPSDDPRVPHLLHRIQALDLTHERYLALSAVLAIMEATPPVERDEHGSLEASPPPPA